MKKRMVVLFSVILAASLLIVAFAGCGEKDKEAEATTGKQTTSETTEAQSEETTETKESVVLNGNLIKELTVFDRFMDNWSIEENLQVGDKIYGDRDFTFDGTIPDILLGSEWIRTANDSEWRFENGEWQAEFTAAEDIDAYLVRKSDYMVPAEWMEGWEDTGGKVVEADGAEAFIVFKKTFKAGEKVQLGVDSPEVGGKGNYVVIVKPTEKNSCSEWNADKGADCL